MNGKTSVASQAADPAISKTNLSANLNKLWYYLLETRGREIALLFLFIVIAALLEMATLASILPLIGSLLESNSATVAMPSESEYLPEWIRHHPESQTLIIAGVILVVSVSAIVRIGVMRIIVLFSASVAVELQTRLFENLLHREYEQIINESSSQSIAQITNKIQLVVANYILGTLSSLSSLVSAIAVVILLLWISTSVVLLALLLLAIAYGLIAWLTRIKLRFYGRELQTYVPKKIQCVQEGLGGIRDVVMGGHQKFFLQNFHQYVSRTEAASARLSFYQGFARPLIETVGIISIALIAWITYKGWISGEQMLPTLGVFAVGMIRLLPYVQQIFALWTKIVNGQFILAELVEGLVQSGKIENTQAIARSTDESIELPAFTNDITLKNVNFSYQSASYQALENINLSFHKGEYIGIVGPTGSGKSTLVDILMGLLPPTSGHLIIDDVPIVATNRSHWREKVAHVPQKIYLMDGTIERNIAFAVPEKLIDHERVVRCAQQACLDTYINDLPQGYQTAVGEQGVRLSGGQRQRIGIARALYEDCQVLVFDEATNALDEETERAVIGQLLQPQQNYTIFCISHNMDTVKSCHRLLNLQNGRAKWVR